MTSASQAPKGKGMIITGAVLMVLALLLGITSVIGGTASAASGLAGVLNAQTLSAPGEFSTTLGVGEYTVYQLADGTAAQLTSTDIAVEGPGGTVEVLDQSGSETVTRDQDTFAAVATFTVSQAGDYVVKVDSADATEVVVAPSFVSGIKAAVGWFFGGLLAALMGFVGLILLIVGLVRRSGSKKALAAGPAASAAAVGGQQGWPGSAPSGPAAAGGQVAAGGTAEPGDAAVVGGAGMAGGAAAAGGQVAAGGADAAAAQPGNPPANWYPDPENPGRQRYWDGSAWTEHRA